MQEDRRGVSTLSPIENLAKLLMLEFQKDQLEPELSKYSGDFPEQVLEYCIENDPNQILNTLCGLPMLRMIAKRLDSAVSEQTLNDKEEAVRHILLNLGFSIPPKFLGLNDALENVREAERNFVASGEQEKKGIIMNVYSELERILRDIFAFYSRFLWKEEIERTNLDAFLSTRLKVVKPLNTLGLGELIALLRQVDSLLASDKSLRQTMSELFDREYLLSKGNFKILDEISKNRKFFIHPKGAKVSDSDCEQIITSTSILLEEFETTGLYPYVICLNELVTNRYGTKYVRAEDEFGGKWVIYTDQNLNLGKCYFMLPKTYPIAVRPVLIEKS